MLLPKPEFKASVYDDTLQVLARLLHADLAQLKQMYGDIAIDAVTSATAVVQSRVQRTIVELITSGAHVAEGVETLTRVVNASFPLETIFRTQTQMAYGAGRWQADQHPYIQEMLWGYEYNTVGDDRVRADHAAMDGVKRKKDDPFWEEWWPPNGYNCRCIALPLYVGEGERQTKV